MKLIDRYILVSVLKATLLTLLAIAVLSYVLTLMDELGDAGKGEYGIADVMLVVGSMVPRFLYEAFPVAALIGALLAMGGMANSGELVAMRAAGMSVMSLMSAVFKAGLALLLLIVLVGDVAGPELERWGRDYRLEKMNRQVTFRSRHGFWVRDQDAIVNISRATPEGRLKNIHIYELDGDHRLKRVTHARRGEYRDGRWVLLNVRQSTFGPDRMHLKQMRRLGWETVVDPAMLQVALIKPDLMPAWELYSHVQALRRGGQRATEYAIAFWNKLATPLVMLAMLLLAVPLVMSGQRSVNAGQRVLMGAVFGAAFYLVSKGFSYAVLALDLPPVSVALFPLLALGLAAWGVLRWKRS